VSQLRIKNELIVCCPKVWHRNWNTKVSKKTQNMKKTGLLLGFALLFSAVLFAQDPPKQKPQDPKARPQPVYRDGAQPKQAANAPATFKTKAGAVRMVKAKPALSARKATVAAPKK
jgi:hypothetical protein